MMLYESKGGGDGGDGHVTAPCHRVMLGNEGRRKLGEEQRLQITRFHVSSNIWLLSEKSLLEG